MPAVSSWPMMVMIRERCKLTSATETFNTRCDTPSLRQIGSRRSGGRKYAIAGYGCPFIGVYCVISVLSAPSECFSRMGDRRGGKHMRKQLLVLLTGTLFLLAPSPGVRAAEPVTILYFPISAYATSFIAKDEGFFNRHGLNIELKAITN